MLEVDKIRQAAKSMKATTVDTKVEKVTSTPKTVLQPPMVVDGRELGVDNRDPFGIEAEQKRNVFVIDGIEFQRKNFTIKSR